MHRQATGSLRPQRCGDKVVAYDIQSGETRPLGLRLHETAEAQVTRIVGHGIVVYRLGRHLYFAFSLQAKCWDVVELPEGCSATPIVGPGTDLGTSTATLKWKGHNPYI